MQHGPSVRARLEYLIKGYSSDFSHGQLYENRHITPIWRKQFAAMAAQAGLLIHETYRFGTYKRVSFAKRLLFRALEKIMPADAAGRTRLWVLDKCATRRPIGPDSVH